jgi:putative membrane-bound dehydrogenase-like protein
MNCPGIFIICAVVALSCAGEQPAPPTKTNAPQEKPAQSKRPAGSLAGFKVRTGFRIETVAAYPMVSSPVAMAFDENGRLFVCDLPEYRTGADATLAQGKVRLLEDSDGDGAFDSSTLYADNVPGASAVACYAGGVFVASAPNVLYLKDTRHDGIADVRNSVLTGFGGTNAPRTDKLMHSLTWGLDGRIHGGTAGMGGKVAFVGGTHNEVVPLEKADFSFDARSLEVRAETGPSMNSLVFDNFGREYLLAGPAALRLAIVERRYALRNFYYPPPPGWTEVSGPGSTSRAGAPSPGSSANIGAGVVTGPKDARALLIYRGGVFGEAYRGQLFLADASARTIYCAAPAGDRPGAVLTPSPGDAASVFLSCTEENFQPTQLVNGPDGAIYVADFGASKDQGRILRIIPESFHQSPAVRLGKVRTPELITKLAATNGWQSDTAARLLYERQDKTAVPALSNMVVRARLTLPRIRALHALAGLGALNEAVLGAALSDNDEHLREQAVLVSEGMIHQQKLPDSLFAKLAALADDPSAVVRHQLALTLGECRQQGRVLALARILASDLGDPAMTSTVMSSLRDGGGEMLSLLGSDANFRNSPRGREVLSRLAGMIGVEGKLDEVAQAVAFLDTAGLDGQTTFSLIAELGEGLHRTRSSLPLVDTTARLRRFYNQALNATIDGSQTYPLRVQCIRLLGQSSYSFMDVADILYLLVGSGEPQDIQSATIATLARYSDVQVIPNFLARWGSLTPALRAQTVAGLTQKTDRIPAVLTAIEKGQIQRGDVSTDLVNFLRADQDPAIRKRAVALFGPLPVARTETLDRFRPAIRLHGDSHKGAEIFTARCASCHGVHPTNPLPGPEVSRFGNKDTVLKAILEPNREVQSFYRPMAIETRAGETFLGLVNDDRPETIIVTRRDGSWEIWPMSNITSMEPQPWSWMPTGLEDGLTPQSMADLLEYVAAK